MTTEAAWPEAGASWVFGYTTTRLAPESATNKFDAASTANPCGDETVRAECAPGAAPVKNEGCPYTRMADAPVPAPTENSSTRWLPLSDTKRLPSGPMANPD